MRFHRATSNFAGYVAPLWPRSTKFPKQNFNDRMLRALKPAAAGKRYEKRDALGPRPVGSGHRDRQAPPFMLQSRFPGSTQPTRRAIGEYDAISLDKARQKGPRLGWS